MNQFNRYLSIQKIDEEKQMVYGYASTKDMDSDGEIIELNALKKALPDYLKFPTLREMHQPKVAGTTKTAEVDSNGMYIGAKVLNKDAWEMVKGGGYKGFSIGGNVVKRSGNIIKELELVEISLVDVPANKGAKIELWKNGKFTKDAVGVNIAVELMNACRLMISDCEMRGKSTKKLEKLLEQIKAIVADEAGEPEYKPDTKVSDLSDEALLKVQIESLEQADFGNNTLADALRKGVLLAMKDKQTELQKEKEAAKIAAETVAEAAEKENEEKEEGVTETTTADTSEKKDEEETQETDTTSSEEDPTKVEEKVEETEEEPAETTEEDDKKEVGRFDAQIQKVQEAAEKLGKIAPEKKVEKKDESLAKAMNTMSEAFAKMAETVIGLEERLRKVESTPAATKSKSAVVYKSEAEKQEMTEKSTQSDPNSEIGVKKARFAELEKLFSTLGPNEFAKAGYSTEAMTLQAQIQELEKVQA